MRASLSKKARTKRSLHTMLTSTWTGSPHCFWLAWAMAGCTGHRTLHRSLNLDADTTKFVSVRLDTIYKYYFRAKRSTMILPMSQQPQWLQAPVEERSEWVSKFGESTLTLGQVINEVYTSRDAHWTSPGTPSSEKKTPAPTAASAVSPSKPYGSITDEAGQTHQRQASP